MDTGPHLIGLVIAQVLDDYTYAELPPKTQRIKGFYLLSKYLGKMSAGIVEYHIYLCMYPTIHPISPIPDMRFFYGYNHW